MKKITGIALVWNKALCAEPMTRTGNQNCNAFGSLQCPLMSNEEHQLSINNTTSRSHYRWAAKHETLYLWNTSCVTPSVTSEEQPTKHSAPTNGYRSFFNRCTIDNRTKKSRPKYKFGRNFTHSSKITIENTKDLKILFGKKVGRTFSQKPKI